SVGSKLVRCCAEGEALRVVNVQPAARIVAAIASELPASLFPPERTTTSATTTATTARPAAPNRSCRLRVSSRPCLGAWRCLGAWTFRGGGGVRGFLATGRAGYQALM